MLPGAIFKSHLLTQAIGGITYWEEGGLYNVTGGCGNIASLPTLTFTLDGTEYPLSPQEYVLQVWLMTSDRNISSFHGSRTLCWPM